jgi:hypothetical protein
VEKLQEWHILSWRLRRDKQEAKPSTRSPSVMASKAKVFMKIYGGKNFSRIAIGK